MDEFSKSLLPEGWKKDNTKIRNVPELFEETVSLFKDVGKILAVHEKRIKTLEDGYSRSLKREERLLDVLEGKVNHEAT